jgi:hypothetical protein
MIPESMKTPAFAFTALGLLLYIATTDPIPFFSNPNIDSAKRSNFYNIGFFILWGLAFNATLASCEWNREWMLLVKFVRVRVLRQREDHNDEKAEDEKRDNEKSDDEKPVKVDHPVSFDALMLAPYVISMIASIDALLRTVKGDKSEQHAIATIIARASSTFCCIALCGPAFRSGDDSHRITVRPTSLRSHAWGVLLLVSTLASVSNWFK